MADMLDMQLKRDAWLALNQRPWRGAWRAARPVRARLEARARQAGCCPK
jgi:hypothetical protein